MSPRALAVVLTLAGCSGGGGLDLVVPSTSGVAHVALYFSVGDDSHEPIAPRGFVDPVAPNNWWARDEFSHLDVRNVTGSDVVFELARGDNGESKLSIAIVVGFDAQMNPIAAAKLTGIDIPSDSLDRHIVRLLPLGNSTDAKTWGPESAPQQCVAYADGAAQRIDMVVGVDDLDCDGLLTGAREECVPNVYMGAVTAPLDLVSCLLPEPVASAGVTVDACVLGGPRCLDGVGPQLGCEASTYCIPASVCRQCETHGGFACAANIASINLNTGELPTHIECHVGLKEGGNGEVCGDEMFAWPDLWQDLSGRTCTGGIRITRGMGFDTHVTLPVDTAPAGMNPLDIAVKELQPNCNFKVNATGFLGSTGRAAALVAGDLDNGRGVSIPIVVVPDPNVLCGAPVDCSVTVRVLNDYTFECINTATRTP